MSAARRPRWLVQIPARLTPRGGTTEWLVKLPDDAEILGKEARDYGHEIWVSVACESPPKALHPDVKVLGANDGRLP